MKTSFDASDACDDIRSHRRNGDLNPPTSSRHQQAKKLAAKHPTLHVVVGHAASDAQRNLGLGAKFGMQRSGVLIVDSSTVPVYEHAATMPIFALDKEELLKHLR